MKDGILSKTDIKELTNFLPLLYDENIELSKSPKKGTTDLWGGFYVYHPTVNTFFELASQEHWKDYQYVDNFSDRMIKPGEIEKASIYEIKTIQSKTVRYSNLGNSESITKLYAISDSKQTMVIVNLASNSLGSTQTTDQQTIKIKIIGKITLKI